MKPNNMASKTEATAEFEHDLIDLIMGSFGRGAAVEGVWDISPPVSGTPKWTVTVERHETDEDSSYDPEFLEE